MTTKLVTASGKGAESYETARRTAEEAMKKLGKKPGLAVVYCDVSYDVNEVLKGVREITSSAPLIGCTSYGEFTEKEIHTGTVSIALIYSDDMRFFTAITRNVKEDPYRAAEALKKALPSEVKGFPHRYGLLYIDSLMGVSEEVVLNVNLVFPDTAFVGGGAADISMEAPIVFSNDEAASNAMAMCLIFSKKKLGMSVTHGMTPASGPFEVTKAKDNIVYELNNRPAWKVWKEAVMEEVKKDYSLDISEMSRERSMSILLVHYPLALKTGENSYKIRGVSWVTKEGAIVFMCGVAESSEFYVMKCTNEELINAAKNGAKIALDNLGAKPAGALIANCVSRGAILDKEFIREVDEIRKTVSAPLLGFEAMGEICMAPGQFSGFHNATIVTLVLPE